MMVRLLLSLLIGVSAWAGEYAVLRTGFRIPVERHEAEGGAVRLYTAGGQIQLPAGDVVRFEAGDWVPPAPPVVAPVLPTAPSEPSPKDLIDQAAGGRPDFSALLHSVARVESGYRADAVSPKGAVGVMQLMPATAAALEADPRDARQNVEAGARYLRELLLKYMDQPDQVRLAVAAYNAGPGAVDRHRGVPPYRETQLYVEKVIRELRTLRK